MIDVNAVDVHVHAEVSVDGHPSLPAHLSEGAAAYFGADRHMPTVPEIAAYYRERHIAAVVFTVDAEAATGHPTISNEEIATACAEHADVLIPFASIDPAKDELRRASVRAFEVVAASGSSTRARCISTTWRSTSRTCAS